MKWTAEQEAILTELYEGEPPASVIGKRLGRSVQAVRTRAFRLGLTDPQRTQRVAKIMAEDRGLGAYISGRSARQKGCPKVVPGGLRPVARAYWLAGWHDVDMELGHSVIAEGAA